MVEKLDTLTESTWQRIKTKVAKGVIYSLIGLMSISPIQATDAAINIHVKNQQNESVENVRGRVYNEGLLQDENYSDNQGLLQLLATLAITENQGFIKFAMDQNSSNPFYESTKWGFSTLAGGKLTIIDISGRQIANYDIPNAGIYNATWGGVNAQGIPVAKGLYIYSVTTNDGKTMSKKMIYLGQPTTGLNVTGYSVSGFLGRDTRDILQIILDRENMTTRELNYDITSDTTLTAIVNEGPEIQTEIPTQEIALGDTAIINLNDYIRNDSETSYESNNPDFIITGNEISYIGNQEGLFETTIEARDVLDPSLVRTMNYRVNVTANNHAPEVSLENQVLSSDEGTPSMQIGTASVIDPDTGDEYELEVIEQTHSDSATVYLNGNAIILEKHEDFNGNIEFAVRAIDNGGLDGVAYMSHHVNPIADITLNVRNLFLPGNPIMSDIESMIQMGDSTWYAYGTIKVQMPAGTHETWAENPETGVFDGENRVDPYIIIRSPGMQVIEQNNLAQRDLDDAFSEITIGTQDKVLDLYKIVGLSLADWLNYNQVLDSRTPAGLDKPNVLQPNVYIDENWSPNYSIPSDTTLILCQYVENVLIPSVTSEEGYLPQWLGFVQPPAPDPNGETFFRMLYDITETIGSHGESVNANNEIYEGNAILPPNTTTLGPIIGEIIASQLGFRNDPTGSALGAFIINWQDQNNDGLAQIQEVTLNNHAYKMWKIIAYFDAGTNF